MKHNCKESVLKRHVRLKSVKHNPLYSHVLVRFMCLNGCKKCFKNGCRPFIGVDGCHLKSSYGGQLLVTVVRDPNDQYFPLSFVVVENECKES